MSSKSKCFSHGAKRSESSVIFVKSFLCVHAVAAKVVNMYATGAFMVNSIRPHFHAHLSDEPRRAEYDKCASRFIIDVPIFYQKPRL